jgi:hypothetical protein
MAGMRRNNQAGILLVLGVVLGCADNRPQNTPIASLTTQSAENRFDSTSAGTITGRVSWRSAIPSVAPIETQPNPQAGEILRVRQHRPNPNAPLIHAMNKGVGNAVVFLRGIDQTLAKPWNLALVRIEQRDAEFHLLQGSIDSHFGFVRAGQAVELVSRDRFFHSLHAGGAAFFTLTFPDPDQPITRSLNEKGVVELTSGAGYYWMRAYLFVDDHPYYARTDAGGRFTLAQVPPGSYEVVCWLPNWRKARHDRDPESGVITRWYFAKPLEASVSVTVAPRQSQVVDFLLPP